jgi:hypothetical protein
MTAMILKTAPLVRMAAPAMQAVYRALLRTFDALAEARMRSTQREITRCSRWMQQAREPTNQAALADR